MPLDKDANLTVQRIYYPGLTSADLLKRPPILTQILLLILTPPVNISFRLTRIAMLR